MNVKRYCSHVAAILAGVFCASLAQAAPIHLFLTVETYYRTDMSTGHTDWLADSSVPTGTLEVRYRDDNPLYPGQYFITDVLTTLQGPLDGRHDPLQMNWSGSWLYGSGAWQSSYTQWQNADGVTPSRRFSLMLSDWNSQPAHADLADRLLGSVGNTIVWSLDNYEGATGGGFAGYQYGGNAKITQAYDPGFAASVPEPATWELIAVAGAFVSASVWLKRRKRKVPV